MWRLWRSGPACWRVCIGLRRQACCARAGFGAAGGLAGGVWRGGETDKYFAAFRGEIEMILFRFFFYRCMNESPHFPQFPGRMGGCQGPPQRSPVTPPHCLAKLWEMVFFDIFCFSGLLPFSALHLPSPHPPKQESGIFAFRVALLLIPKGAVFHIFRAEWGVNPPSLPGKNCGKQSFPSGLIAWFLHVIFHARCPFV